jgi:hypothetical protein
VVVLTNSINLSTDQKMALSESAKQTNVRASSLDIDDAALRELSERFVGLVTDYFARVAEVPVFPNVTGAQLKERFDTPPPVEKEPIEKVLDDCAAVIDGSRHNGHPRFFGYVASPATPVGAFADLVASAWPA